MPTAVEFSFSTRLTTGLWWSTPLSPLLGHLAETSFDVAPADERGGKGEEHLMDVRPPLVADGEPTKAAEPSQGAFYHPVMSAQALAALNAASGDPDLDVPLPQGLAAARRVIGFVCVELGRSLARPPSPLLDRRHGVD